MSPKDNSSSGASHITRRALYYSACYNYNNTAVHTFNIENWLGPIFHTGLQINVTGYMKRGHFAQSLISQYSVIKFNFEKKKIFFWNFFLPMSNFVLLPTSTKNLEPLAHF